MPNTTATAPAEAETVATHKEDNRVSPSALTVTGWRKAIIAWYAGGPKPPISVRREANRHGVSDHPPASAKDRVRTLTLTGFDEEDIIAAVPELNAVHIIDIIERIPAEAMSILEAHVNGNYTPLEIAELTGITRPKIYYWLKKVGLKPHKRNRDELSARQRSQIVKAYNNGEPMTSIADRFNASYDQVRYAVKQAS